MKLASAERITAITSIEGADQIETANLLGWQIVIKKNEFKAGDLVGYIQTDTIVPESTEFEFLRSRDFRVRTIKLRKQISQGLIVPLPGKYNEGDDLTEVLGIKKYSKDKEVIEDKPKMPKKGYKKYLWILKHKYLVKVFPSLKKVNRAAFPKHLVSITDEERIQNMPAILEKYKGKLFIVSEKLDGSSITIIHEKKKSLLGKSKSIFRVCSRRFELFNNDNEWYKVFVDTNFKEHILKLVDAYNTDNIIVQGEYIGKPQGNKYQLQNNEIRLFNIIINGKRMNQADFYATCHSLNIPCCPYVEITELDFTLPQLLQYAEGKSLLNKNTEREGLVLRCFDDNLSFKVISNKWLLKNNE